MSNLISVAVAFCVCILGYLLLTTHFGKSEKVDSLLKKNSALKTYLKEKEKALQSLRDEAVRLNEKIRSLECQLGRKDSEFKEIQHEIMQREGKIALLEKTVRDVLSVPSKSGNQSK